MRALALDQSLLSCGYALWDGGRATLGTWRLADNLAGRPAGFFELRRQLTRLHKAAPIDIIAHETPIKTPMDKIEKLIALYGLIAVIEGWAYARRIPVYSVDQRNHRESWLGDDRKGRDREELKRLAVLRARQFGYEPRNADEAEALAVLDNVLGSLKIAAPWRVETPFLETLA